MATFDEIFQSYVQYGFTKPMDISTPSVSTPSVSTVSPVQGIESISPVQPETTVTGDTIGTTTAPTSTGKEISSISISDIGKVIGFITNPVLGIASLGFEKATGLTPMQAVQNALASIGIGDAATGPTAPGAGMGFGGGYATDVGFGGFGGFGTTGPTGVDVGTGPAGCATGPSTDVGTGPGGCDSGTTGPSTDSGTGPGGCSNGGGDGGDGGDGGAGAGGGDAGTGPGGCGYATGGRVGYADGAIAPIDYQSYLNSMKNYYAPVGSVDPMDKIDFSNFYNKGEGFKQRIYLPYAEFVNALDNFHPYVRIGDESVKLGNWDYVAPDKSLIQPLRPAGSGGLSLPYSREELEKMYLEYLKQPKEPGFNELSDTSTPTEDFSDYLNGLTPNWSPGDRAPEGYEVVSGNGDTWIEPIARTLFPQTNLQQIKETATSPTQYNIEATKDLVQNLPAVVQPFAPAVAGVMSLPYDAIQAYQRMQPGSGISGFAKAYAAERPLQSAYERFVGASGPLAENINKAVSNLNPFQQQQYMQYAVNNPQEAAAAAQRNQDLVQATQRTQQESGGRVGFESGGSYWLTVQETYDAAGGEEGTGMSLIDFANKYFPKMATGGRVGYLQGGLVSLLK